MPKLTNRTDQPITASTGHTIPAEGDLTVSAGTLARIAKEPFIARHMRAETLTVAYDEPEAKGLSRADVAKMNRGELLDVILAHYDDSVTAEDFKGVNVNDKGDEDGLRTIAARLLFSDL
ncbi:hypothetical protein [Roseovarius sp. MMSF_3281]|uniref:hypothetical protein n=1 Tax=Roseovarius sp. MMSF_3281 TaxID=3046694 RepID=UPI00273E8672|nr:hypothetical protein [Roseovarius sp. MMSF_3281]